MTEALQRATEAVRREFPAVDKPGQFGDWIRRVMELSVKAATEEDES